MHVIEHDPTSSVKFVPKEAAIPRHLSDEEERVLVAAVHATGTLRDRAIITLLLHTGLRARELCTVTRKQVHVGKRNGTLRIIGKRNKVRDVPLNATARAVLSEYLETHPSGSVYLFPSEKTQEALTERALGHLITKYARRAHLVDVSPHDLRHRFGYRMAEVVPCIVWLRSRGMTRWIRRCSTFVERDGTYSATWRKSHEHSSRRPFVNLFSWKHGKSERGKMMLSIFISYAHRDEPLLKELEEHLALLQNQRVITTWHDRDISAGTEWEREIDTHLNTAHIILLLISASFLASKYCYSTEMKRAMERHKAGEACVIPVILRPVDWKGAPFGRLQALPTKAQPITSWSDRDEAFLDVAKGIRDAIEKLMIRSQPRKIALFGYETQGGKSSVLWSGPGTFSLNETYLEWFETKRDFTEREIVNHTWVKAGDHGYSFTVHFLPHGQLHESPLLDPARQLQGSWKRIDGALRTTIEQVEDGALVKYELDIFANRNGSLHSGIESSDSTETAHAYFVFLPSQQLTTKHLEEALAAFDQLLCVNQHCVEAYKAKGNLLRDLGRYKEALDACQRAIELKPDYMWAWYDRGGYTP